MRDNTSGNRRRYPRYTTDQFVPAVIVAPGSQAPLGGHLVDISLGGTRMVAAPNLVDAPSVGQELVLVFARSDGNRELDIDGERVPATVVEVREPMGARVIRLQFKALVPSRIERWIRRLAREGSTADGEALPDFDPDVWAGWAAIVPGAATD